MLDEAMEHTQKQRQQEIAALRTYAQAVTEGQVEQAKMPALEQEMTVFLPKSLNDATNAALLTEALKAEFARSRTIVTETEFNAENHSLQLTFSQVSTRSYSGESGQKKTLLKQLGDICSPSLSLATTQ